MSLLHYDAINLGEKDLQYGRQFLTDMKAKYDLPFVSANVLISGEETPFTQRYIVKKLGELKVGIFGVTTPSVAKRFVNPETGFQIVDPVFAATSVVGELQKQRCDVIVALAHLGVAGAQELAKSVPGIDIIVAGHGWNRSQKPTYVGKTVLMMSGDKGKYLGELDFAVQNDSLRVLAGKTVPLSDKVADDLRLAQLVKEFDNDVIYQFPMESPKALDHFGANSVKTCIRCHRKQYQQWKSTRHYEAWQALVGKKQYHNETCQKCHTTLYGQAGGYASVEDTPDMVNVQCVACHRPVTTAEAHLQKFRRRRFPSKNETVVETVDFKPVTEALCLPCHDAQNSPNFTYDAYLERVQH